MNLETFLLFVSCLLFAGFNLYVNTASNKLPWAQLIFLLFGLLGILAAGYILVCVVLAM